MAKAWTNKEIERLAKVWPRAKFTPAHRRGRILEMFPGRTWVSLKEQARLIPGLVKTPLRGQLIYPGEPLAIRQFFKVCPNYNDVARKLGTRSSIVARWRYNGVSVRKLDAAARAMGYRLVLVKPKEPQHARTAADEG